MAVIIQKLCMLNFSSYIHVHGDKFRRYSEMHVYPIISKVYSPLSAIMIQSLLKPFVTQILNRLGECSPVHVSIPIIDQYRFLIHV